MTPLRRMLPIVALIFAAAGPLSVVAGAAPFCIRNQIIPPQCIYDDAEACQREASRQNAECAANPAELALSAAHGEYCVVTGSRAAVCVYADWQSCAVEAARQHGACTQALPDELARQPNPYSPGNGR